MEPRYPTWFQKSSMSQSRKIRFAINGALATFLHFSILYLCLNLVVIDSAGLSNGIASFFGIGFSFMGNRYFVFRSQSQSIRRQFAKFFFAYVIIAIVHGVTLLIWTDFLNYDYRIGFVIAVIIQVILGYVFGSKYVFTQSKN